MGEGPDPAPMTALGMPDTVRLGERSTVRLVVPPAARRGEEGEVRTRRVGISRVRQANLTADGFAVHPRTPPLRLVDSVAPTEWSWVLTATEPGAGRVRLVLHAVVEVEGAERVGTLGVWEQRVAVRESPWRRISRLLSANWAWLVAVALLAIFAWIRERRRARAWADVGEADETV